MTQSITSSSPLLGSSSPPSSPLLGASSTKRLLTPNVISLLSIGSTIGTGLFFSVSTVLVSGPLISILAYGYIAAVCSIILFITTQLSCRYPLNGSLCHFQSRFLSSSIGLSNNIVYWLSWSFTLALELTITYSILQYWSISLSRFSCILIVWSILTVINLMPVNYYAVAEVSISLIKLMAIIAWILLMLLALVGINPWWEPIGFAVWTQNWPASFIGGDTNTRHRVVSLLTSLVSASFTFQSVESIALSAGELQNPSSKSFRTLTKLVFVRIIVFYLVSILLLTLTIPYNDKQLMAVSPARLASSPFLIALHNAHYKSSPALLSTFNLIILTAIVSAANSNIYFGSRCLLAMVESSRSAQNHWLLTTSARGVPYPAIGVTAIIGLVVALLPRSESAQTIFNTLLNTCASAGLLMWCLLSFSYIRYHQRCGYPPQNTWLYRGAWFSGVNIAAILLGNGILTWYQQQNRDWFSLVNSYLTVIVFVVIWTGCHLLSGSHTWLIPLDRIQL